MVNAILLPFSAALGLICGSFANVLIHRLPRAESVVFPGSHCPSCAAPIPWYLNIPIVSWLGLRGRSACCKTPISARYPFVELLMGLLFLACAWTWGPGLRAGEACTFCLLCVPLGLIDLEHQILPDRLTYPGIVAGFAFSLSGQGVAWWESLLGAALGAALPAAVIGGYWLIRGEEGMGWGDVKLLALIGAFLGWRGALLALLAGALLGTLIGGSYLLFSGRGRKTPLPFGTFLCAAALAVLFFGESAWRWYAGLLLPTP
jgi:leader peptidase (prepilin peptidase) / N-methyltransferase